MSIAARMKHVALREPVDTESPTGAVTSVMTPIATITASIAPLSQRAIAALGEKHTETTHLALVRGRHAEITNKHDILDGTTVYHITSVTPLPRTTLVYVRVLS